VTPDATGRAGPLKIGVRRAIEAGMHDVRDSLEVQKRNVGL
jgi:hypothetical protein